MEELTIGQRIAAKRRELELLLFCELSTGQQLQQTVDTFCPANFKTQ